MQRICDRVDRNGKTEEAMQLLCHHYMYASKTAAECVVTKLRNPKTSIIELLKLQVGIRSCIINNQVPHMNLSEAEVGGLDEYGNDVEKYGLTKTYPCWSQVNPLVRPPPPSLDSVSGDEVLIRPDPEPSLQFMANWSDRGESCD